MPLGAEAFYGLAGRIVRRIEPHTEADPAAILVQLLAAVGSAVGRGPGFMVEADRHYCNLFVAIVGQTATARKGSSWGQARRLVRLADPTWADRVKTGASSGEGLIFEVKDEGEEDEGRDKRLLIVEPELASVLERMGISGNTLSAVLRQAWDGGKLDTLVKNNRATATDAHVSLIGHITADELDRKLTATEQANGFANRILWVYAKRSKSLPFGGDLAGVDWTSDIESLKAVLTNAKRTTLGFSPAAKRTWTSVYDDFYEVPPHLLGAVTSRGSAQVRRIAVIYALLDQADVVDDRHLRAAIEVWRYSADSAALLFGANLGDPTADVILAQLRDHPKGLRLTEIAAIFGRHLPAVEVHRALDKLQKLGLARRHREATSGRPAERWFAIDPSTTGTARHEGRKKRVKRRRPR